MMEVIIALICGVAAGTFTGISPGIHINLVSSILLVSSGFLLSFASPFSLAIFIISMSITHTFVDFIPSVYLGAPDEDTSLSVLPGHSMLLEGKGHEAVFLTLIGSLGAVILSLIIIPLFFIFLPLTYEFFQRMMGFALILTSIFLLSSESNSKLWAFIIFILSGFLGISSLGLNVNQPLLPLFSGLFGSSALIYSMSKKTKVPEQIFKKVKMEKREIFKPLLTTSLISPICSFLPGLGSSQAAIIGSSFFKLSSRQFLILIGSINTLVMIGSFFVLFILDKYRTGSAAAISQLTVLSASDIIPLSVTIIISAALAFFISIYLSKIFTKIITKINYSAISFLVIILLFLVVLIFSGFLGIMVFIVSTLLGLFCQSAGIRKGHLMGCLLIPTILYYLPF